jgi:hypothetical protein
MTKREDLAALARGWEQELEEPLDDSERRRLHPHYIHGYGCALRRCAQELRDAILSEPAAEALSGNDILREYELLRQEYKNLRQSLEPLCRAAVEWHEARQDDIDGSKEEPAYEAAKKALLDWARSDHGREFAKGLKRCTGGQRAHQEAK